MLNFGQITAFIMKRTITYRWIAAAVASALLVITILLVGHGGSEIPPSANTAPISSHVTQESPQNPAPTKKETPSHQQEEQTSSSRRVGKVEKWDVVVVGRIDACYLCQRGSPHVDYTRVLAGKLPNGHRKGTLTLAGIAPHVLPEGEVPLYQSQQDEIVFLKKAVVDHKDKDKNEDEDIYTVVDVMKATSENLALFHDE